MVSMMIAVLGLSAAVMFSFSCADAADCSQLAAALPSSCTELVPRLQAARPQLLAASQDQQAAGFKTFLDANKLLPACCTAGKMFIQSAPYCGCDTQVQAQAKAMYSSTPEDLALLGKAIATACGGTAPPACSASG